MMRVLALFGLSQREQIGLLAVVSVVIILFLIVRARMSRSN
jgi:hypothetical protein